MMRIVFAVTISLVLFITLVLAEPKSGKGADSPADAAAKAYLEADNLMTCGEDAERDKQAYQVAERGLTGDLNNYQWLWRVARGAFYAGDSAAKNDKLRFFERGIEVAQKAVAQQANGVEGHFWLGANYGGYSEQKGAFKALRMVKDIRAEMELVLSLNDRYQDGSAYLALGEIDRQLPGILGGDLKRGITRLEKGVQVAPQNLELKLGLARAYQEAGRKDDARRQLQEILGRQINPARAKTEREVQEKSRALLGKL
jgi:tetratricopeptide (TPR) repeat protein